MTCHVIRKDGKMQDRHKTYKEIKTEDSIQKNFELLSSIHQFTHPSIHLLQRLSSQAHEKPGVFLTRQGTPWTGCQPITGHVHTNSHTTHNLEIYSQPTVHAFGLGEENRVPEKNSRRTHKLHTHRAEAMIEPSTMGKCASASYVFYC